MTRILVVGTGGVGKVAARKLAQMRGTFSELHLASRTLSRCQAVAHDCGADVKAHRVDASSEADLLRLFKAVQPRIVLNVALPYQDLPIMKACLRFGAHYVDTACPETPGEIWSSTRDEHWYGTQWNLHDAYVKAGLTGILGIGSDPGMVNVFAAYAQKHLFDSVKSIDILDVNAGSHGYPFATNFNPEINLREVQSPAHYWEDGTWKTADALSVRWDFEFPEIGRQPMYLMDHDEVHSLRRHFPDAGHIKFWMGFGEQYVRHFKVLRDLGLLSHRPIDVSLHDGRTVSIPPLKMLEAVLPDPASLAPRYTGKTCIGTLVGGVRQGVYEERFLYNVCDHERCYREVGSQAISYTAAAPAVAAVQLLASGAWKKPGVFNVEQLDPDPFMASLGDVGLPWHLTSRE